MGIESKNSMISELVYNRLHMNALDMAVAWTIIKVMVLIGFSYCIYAHSLGPAISLGFFICLMFGVEAEALYEALLIRKVR